MSEKLSTPEPATTVSVAIVYDSGSRGYPALSGRTLVLADAVVKGARMVKGTAVTLIPVADRSCCCVDSRRTKNNLRGVCSVGMRWSYRILR